MDMIPDAIKCLTELYPLRDWPDGAQVLRDIGSKPSAHWLIPEKVCLAVGGRREEALPAVAALIALHTSIVIVDDLLDGDGRFEATGWSQSALVNLVQAITASGFAAILHSPVGEVAKMTIITHLNQMMAQTAVGQHTDPHTVIQDELVYWKLVRDKSAPFFEAAFATGAVLGEAQPEIVTALRHVGLIYGEMIQIHDDLKDAFAIPAAADWRSEYGSLPILFARSVAHPSQEFFIQLQKDLSTPGALEEAQKILLRCGEVSYSIKQLLERGEAARNCLNTLSLINHAPIDELLTQVLNPVDHIFANLMIPMPER